MRRPAGRLVVTRPTTCATRLANDAALADVREVSGGHLDVTDDPALRVARTVATIRRRVTASAAAAMTGAPRAVTTICRRRAVSTIRRRCAMTTIRCRVTAPAAAAVAGLVPRAVTTVRSCVTAPTGASARSVSGIACHATRLDPLRQGCQGPNWVPIRPFHVLLGDDIMRARHAV